MKRIPSLDGLRAFSVCAVIVGHWLGYHDLRGGSAAIVAAHTGVQIFFIISGFLITSLLQDEHAKHGRIDLGAFYRRRAFRILPASLAFIAVVTVFIPASRPGLPYALTYSVSYVMSHIPQTWEHLWSLSNEEQFYLLWPLAMVLTYKYRALAAWVAFAAGLAFQVLITVTGNPHQMNYWFVANNGIAAGCLAAIYLPRIKGFCLELAQSAALMIALPTTALLLNLLNLNRYFVSSLTSAILVFWVVACTQREFWILNCRPFAWVGVLSYSLYLWQQPFTGAMMPLPLALALMFCCASASHYLVEKPMIARGRKLPSLTFVRSEVPIR